MFSVVVPVYNHASYLRGAVGSALASPLVREILLLDDGSRDGSRELVAHLAEAHPGRVVDLTPSEGGNAGAHVRLNQLCRAARSEWIAILNSDDEFLAGRFQSIRMLARRHRADFVAGAMHIIDDDGTTIGAKRGLLDLEYPLPPQVLRDGLDTGLHVLRALCSQNFIATSSNMAFTRALFDRVGGFEDLRYSHDWAFAIRCACLGRVAFTPNALTRYRLHASNTIKEPSAHLDGEVTRFFLNILEDFPEIEADPVCRAALRSNLHLRYSEPSNGGRPGSIGGGGAVLDAGRDVNANALLATLGAGYDFAVISRSLSEPPEIGLAGATPPIFFRDGAAEETLQRGASGEGLRGRVVRLALHPGEPGAPVALADLPGLRQATVVGAEMLIGDPPPALPVSSPPAQAYPGANRRDDRPTILVLPIFMAVGGVERNTIEIIRKLEDRYRFYVATTERANAQQGSLHYQLSDMSIPILDFAEAAEPEHHFALLRGLKMHLKPDLVWICNGSPWLADQASAIRRLFAETPIVDQQVYDTKEGWIGRYGEPGIQSFDHFIAVNERIRMRFVNDFKIPRSRVSLIYSAIDRDKLDRPLADANERRNLKARLGLGDTVAYAYIGRLVEQKNPLAFLNVAKKALAENHPGQFILVGDGVLSGDCDAFIAAEKLSNVKRLKNYSDSWPVMSAIDGLIIPSHYEGLPIALLEALAFGVPALSTDVGDVGLVLGKYGSGRVVADGASGSIPWPDFVGWAEELPALRSAAVAAIPRVLADFSSTTLAESYASLFSRLMAEIPASRGWGRRRHLAPQEEGVGFDAS